MHSEVPELLKDAYWDVVFPDELPYTEASAKFKTTEPPMVNLILNSLLKSLFHYKELCRVFLKGKCLKDGSNGNLQSSRFYLIYQN